MSARVETDAEWRERIGRDVFLSMTCTHDFEGAVCEVCWENTQRVCVLIEQERARATGAPEFIAHLAALADEWYPGEPGPRRMTSWGQLAQEKCARQLRALLHAERGADG